MKVRSDDGIREGDTGGEPGRQLIATNQAVREMGLLRRATWFYAVVATAVAIALAACVTAFILTETTVLRSYGIVIEYLDRVGLAAGADPFDCPAAAQFGRA